MAWPQYCAMPLRRVLQLQYPIVCPPMAGITGWQLAAEVSKGGGLGIIGTNHRTGFTAEGVREDLRRAREHLGPCQGSGERDSAGIDVGVGFLGFAVHKDRPGSIAAFDEAIVASPKCIWLSIGVEEWQVRAATRAEIPVMVQVQRAEEAQRCQEWGAAVLVAQGNESGGHGMSNGPTLELVREVRKATKYRLPVLAAGGMWCGEDAMNAIFTGAAGAVLGTRFALTDESLGSDELKRRMVRATGIGSTTRTRVYDELDGVGWPSSIDGRCLHNAFTTRHGKALPPDLGPVQREALSREIQAALQARDYDTAVVWAGTGVGSMRECAPAGRVLQDLVEDASQHYTQFRPKAIGSIANAVLSEAKTLASTLLFDFLVPPW